MSRALFTESGVSTVVNSPFRETCTRLASVTEGAATTQLIQAFILCSGLGHIHRGFESFSRECFDALQSDPRLDLRLFKGAGPTAEKERSVGLLHRENHLAEWLGRAIGRDAYFIEQLDFVRGLLPSLVRRRPDVVYFSDGAVGNLLWRLRTLIGGRYRLLFSNSGPLSPEHYRRFDHIHQVTPTALEDATRAGIPASRQTLLPLGFRLPEESSQRAADKSAARLRLGLQDMPTVLSVGVVNSSHKRMDYVIRELAALALPRPQLVFLGAADAETPDILSLANRLLGPTGCVHRTVEASKVAEYYGASDAFVLASLSEGFGRVFVEACAAGLPCLVHDGQIQRWVLGPYGQYADFRNPGELGRMLQIVNRPPSDDKTDGRRRFLAENYSWDSLGPRYGEMIAQCAQAAF